MIAEIVPANVVVVDTHEDCSDEVLFAEERASLGAAVEKRRREFTAGRACAHRALERLGLEPCSIPSGPRGEPCWPEGVVGSITHCAGYRACALARGSEIAAVGIDAEPHAPLPDGVLAAIALPEEIDWIQARVHATPTVHWDRLVFSAKEAVYKAWFPLAERRLGFEDASITPLSGPLSFRAQLLASGPRVNGTALTALDGRWLIRDGFVLSAVVLPLRDSHS